MSDEGTAIICNLLGRRSCNIVCGAITIFRPCEYGIFAQDDTRTYGNVGIVDLSATTDIRVCLSWEYVEQRHGRAYIYASYIGNFGLGIYAWVGQAKRICGISSERIFRRGEEGIWTNIDIPDYILALNAAGLGLFWFNDTYYHGDTIVSFIGEHCATSGTFEYTVGYDI